MSTVTEFAGSDKSIANIIDKTAYLFDIDSLKSKEITACHHH
ncbi:hypothetical protein FLA_2988 [Filimonas lacunae]|nr:hypothetical protein FLA_2988 [Filimonas lacunae]